MSMNISNDYFNASETYDKHLIINTVKTFVNLVLHTLYRQNFTDIFIFSNNRVNNLLHLYNQKGVFDMKKVENPSFREFIVRRQMLS